MKPTLSRIAITTGLLLGSFAFAVLAADWSTPTVNPPLNNVPAPINVGGGDVGVTPYSQLKTGLLGLNNLIVKNLQILTAEGTTTTTKGQVLTAIDNDGNVGWRATGTASSGGGLVWENVPLTDTGNYNQSCQYRFYRNYNDNSVSNYDLNGAKDTLTLKGSVIYYITGVYPSRLIYISHIGEVSHIDYDSKSSMYVVNGNPPGPYPVTKMEKSCGTSGTTPNSESSIGWITIDAGSSLWNDNATRYWNDTTIDHSPSGQCKSAGYNYSLGVCKEDHTSPQTTTGWVTKVEGSILSNQNIVGYNVWSIACLYGYGSSLLYVTKENTQILCAK